VPTLAALKGASAATAVAVLDGLVSGWPSDKSPTLSGVEKKTLTSLMESLPESARDRLLALAQKWSQPDLFGTSVAAIIETLKKEITNASLPDDKRAAAAKRLVGIQDSGETIETVLKQITVLSPPALAAGLINALGDSRNTNTGGTIMEHWSDMTPGIRRNAITVLMRRAEWAMSLIDAVSTNKINKTDLAAEHWSQLKQNRIATWRGARNAFRKSTRASRQTAKRS
jgi:hypothetical protein